MLGFTNCCPHCGKRSAFTPEEMECDKSLALWCNHCGEYISQTFTIETFRRWWERFDAGEDALAPPISKDLLDDLALMEKMIQQDENCYLDKVEIHLKDFTDYKYTDEEGKENEV